MDRRSFLRPRNLLKLAEPVLSPAAQNERPISTPGGAIASFRQESMACFFEIQIPADSSYREAVLEALTLIDEVESQWSVFVDDSEISQLNRAAVGEWTRVSPRTAKLLTDCKEYSQLTDGAFDVTAGALLDAWGISRREGVIPADAEIDRMLASMGIEHLEVDADAPSIRWTTGGAKINLGAIGKGYALDLAAEMLRDRGVSSALLSAGHSSILAVGRPAWDTAWRIDLSDPRDLNQPVGQVLLNDRALSTTGDSQQRFQVGERSYSHVIDPRTGRPAESSVSQVTVIGRSAALSEALSTACFVNGIEWANQLASKRPELGLVLVESPRNHQVSRVAHIGDRACFTPAETR